jgi:hypothetical protein
LEIRKASCEKSHVDRARGIIKKRTFRNVTKTGSGENLING